MTIAFYLGIERPVDTSYGEQVSYFLAWVVGFLLFVFYPFALISNLLVTKEKLQEPLYKQMWGGLYGPVHTDNRY